MHMPGSRPRDLVQESLVEPENLHSQEAPKQCQCLKRGRQKPSRAGGSRRGNKVNIEKNSCNENPPETDIYILLIKI